ncbi:hypothetical protein CBM2634_U80022 [Cupriavidus taiwanensis]|uniref:Uncharacterized protein n=1 Tax=Cupriavidus taiwanensis TaxID=164546 RepID=A0A375JDP9_9BURK|nr:hypothetical protein CBM2634_U80022 [Cupriavidus taiwanensis]
MRVRRIVLQNGFDDAVELALLEHLAVALLRGQPQPRDHGQTVACQATVGAELLGLADQAGAAGLPAVREPGDQRDALPEQAVERDIGIGADRNDAPFEQRRDGLAADPGFYRQVADRTVAFERIQAMGRGKQLLVEVCRIHLPMRQTALLFGRATTTSAHSIGYLCLCI